MKLFLFVIIFTVLVVPSSFVLAATFTATQSGRWSQPSTFGGSQLPGYGDSVVIPNGTSVLLDTTTQRLVLVHIEAGGALRVEDDSNPATPEMTLEVRTILVHGVFEMGTECSPLQRKFQVLLTNDDVPPTRVADTTESLFLPPYGSKMLAVAGSGRWDAHAVGRTPTWTQLSATANSGASQITLKEPVDWQVGDEIIVVTTDFSPEQTERRRLTAVQNNGRTLVLDTPLTYMHFGQLLNKHGFEIDMRAEVGVLTSNVRIVGDMVNSTQPAQESAYPGSPYYRAPHTVYGGHTISVDRSFVRLDGIEFAFTGQNARLARYPIHWHHRKDAPGQYAKRCLIHDSFARSITVHDTNDLMIEGNVAFNVIGHSIYLEDGTEERNQFYENLVVSSEAVCRDVDDYTCGSYKYQGCADNFPGVRLSFLDVWPSGFWITNMNNEFVGNVAAGHWYGFWPRVDYVFNEPQFFNNGQNPVLRSSCAAEGVGSTTLPQITSTGLVFVNNKAHSNIESGWWIKENYLPTHPNDTVMQSPLRHFIQKMEGFTAYKNKFGVENYGVTAFDMEHVISVDNAVAFSADWVRASRTKLKSSLLLGESENHGNPNYPSISKTSCSTVFPGTTRTVMGRGGLPNEAIRLPDERIVLEDVVVADFVPNCDQQTVPIVSGQYPGDNMVGIFEFLNKGNSPVPDRRFGLHFDNVIMAKAAGVSLTNDVVDPTVSYFGSGFIDTLGTFPCSAPESQWLFNTPEIPGVNCQYRSNYNMWVCPPSGGVHGYRSLRYEFRRQYSHMSYAGTVEMQGECGTFLPAPQNRFTVETNRNYTFQYRGSTPPNGLSLFIDSDLTSNDPIPEFWVTVAFPGRVDVEYYDLPLPPYQPNVDGGLYNWGTWTPSTAFEAQCTCSGSQPTTYVKVRVTGQRGNELRFNANPSAPCNSSCGNPWQVPVSSMCASRQSIASQNFSTCPPPAPPTAPRVPPTSPLMRKIAVPSTGPNAPQSGPAGFQNCPAGTTAAISNTGGNTPQTTGGNSTEIVDAAHHNTASWLLLLAVAAFVF